MTFSLTLALALPASGRIYLVAPGASIQTAVDSARTGDSVIVEDGEYFESVLIVGRSLTLGSRLILDDDTCHVANTVIHAVSSRTDSGSCILVSHPPSDNSLTSLIGMTLRDGTGTRVRLQSGLDEVVGGAIATNNSPVDIIHCKVLSSTARRGGGIGVACEDDEARKSIRLLSSEIALCTGESWGGGANFINASVEMVDCRIASNAALVSGAGFYAYECSLHVANCLIDSNEGASAIDVNGGYVEIGHSHVGFSSATGPGPCHFDAASCRGYIHHNVFETNLATTLSFVFHYIYQQSPFFESNIVRDCVGLSTTGIMLLSGCRMTIERNLFERNTTSLGAVFQVIGNAFVRNTIRQNVIVNNLMTDPHFGSVLFDATFEGTIIDSNWISGNTASVVTSDGRDHRQFDCRYNWWGHASGPYNAELNPTGQGDTLVGDDCEFIPWLTEPPDTSGWLPAITREHVPISKTWEIVAIYPNPFNSSVTISLAGFTGADFELAVHNLLGQKVDTIQHGALTGTMLHYSAPANLSSGVYFLVARDRGGMQTKKMVLLR